MSGIGKAETALNHLLISRCIGLMKSIRLFPSKQRQSSRFTRLRQFFPLRGEFLEPRALLATTNASPITFADAYVAQQDALLSIAAPGVLSNDRASEHGQLVATVIDHPTHGTLDLHADGGFSYTPFPNYSGPDSFTYKANENQKDSNVATVSLVVNFVPDGSVAAKMLGDINLNATNQVQLNGQIVQLGGLGYFSGRTASNGLRLWQSDGTPAGTKAVGTALSMPSLVRPPVLVNNQLFFSGMDNSSSTQLWKSDGTPEGTVEVKVIRRGGLPSNPSSLTNVNGVLFFIANDGTHGIELWKSDGTTAGTMLVKDIFSGTASSEAASLLNINGTLFFTGYDGTGIKLWKSDGTEAGTVPVSALADNPHDLENVNGTLFFIANDGANGSQLWKSDGRAEGTVIVRAFSDSGPAELTNLSGTLVFTANEGATGHELWKSDGTEQGTTLVLDINPGMAGSVPTALTSVLVQPEQDDRPEWVMKE